VAPPPVRSAPAPPRAPAASAPPGPPAPPAEVARPPATAPPAGAAPAPPGPVPAAPPSPAAAAPAPAPVAPSASPPALRLEVFVYAERAQDRMVFINSKKYLEGQRVEGGYLLEAITPEGAVLSQDGRRFLLRAPTLAGPGR